MRALHSILCSEPGVARFCRGRFAARRRALRGIGASADGGEGGEEIPGAMTAEEINATMGEGRLDSP